MPDEAGELLLRICIQGQLYVCGPIDPHGRLGGIAGSPFVMVRLKKILADRFQQKVMAEGSCCMKVHGLVGLHFLRREVADVSVHLIELKMVGQIHFGLQENLVFGC